MRSQVGASILSRVLQRLPTAKSASADSDILVGLDAPDDAAVIRPPPAGHVMIQTVDFFRSFVDDPYVFGAIAANHALGVRPSSMCISNLLGMQPTYLHDPAVWLVLFCISCVSSCSLS